MGVNLLGNKPRNSYGEAIIIFTGKLIFVSKAEHDNSHYLNLLECKIKLNSKAIAFNFDQIINWNNDGETLGSEIN